MGGFDGVPGDLHLDYRCEHPLHPAAKHLQLKLAELRWMHFDSTYPRNVAWVQPINATCTIPIAPPATFIAAHGVASLDALALRQVIAVGQEYQLPGIVITLFSLEVYQQRMRPRGRVRTSASVRQPMEAAGASSFPVVGLRVEDDAGTTYHCDVGGSSSGSDWEFSSWFQRLLSGVSTTLHIRLLELQWWADRWKPHQRIVQTVPVNWAVRVPLPIVQDE